jgi:hypothetical protein
MHGPATRPARPSGFRRPTLTLGALLLIVAMIALELWLFRVLHAERSLFLLLVTFLGFAVFVIPIFVKGTHRHSNDPRFEPIDPDCEQVPLRVAESIAETVPKLEALGFRSLGHFRNERSVPNVGAYVSLFENPGARRTAHPFTVFGVRHVSTVLSFKTEFTDGTTLITANSRMPKVFPSGLYREGSMSFPWITDPGQLYQVHEASVVHYASDGIPITADILDPVEYLRASSRRELARFAGAGYYRLDEASQVYRLTWMGAYLMSWKLLWPIKPIRQMLRRRKAASMLRELGLDHLSPESLEFDRVPQPQ